MNKELIDNLSAAVSNGRTDIVRTLLSLFENGSNSNAPNVTSEDLLTGVCNPSGTLLHLATKLDHVDIVRTLLSSGANPNIENTLGETPIDLIQSQRMTAVYVDELLKCSAKSELDRIHQLVNAGIDINSQDSPESRNTALHWAVSFGKPEAVQCLLELGATPNVTNGQGATPLHEAVKRKNLQIIKMLLMSGADPMFKCSSGKYLGKTPIDIAEDNRQILDLFSDYVVRDSESENSNEGIQSEQSSKTTIDDINASLMSLSASSDITNVPIKNLYTPQPMHIPPFFSTPLPLITDSKLHLLWPQPQKIVQTDGEAFKIMPKCTVNIIQNTADATSLSAVNVWNSHSDQFKSFGCDCSVEDIIQCNSVYCADIICHISSELFSRMESYKLIISKEQIRILTSDIHGLHYALCTLEQLLNLYREDGTLPSIFIFDWPQLQHRAVLLDFSPGARKPTLSTLKEYIRTMSSLKIKQLHCYFRYEQSLGHTLPLSNKDFIHLSQFCSQYFIMLVPAIDVGTSEKHINVKDCITEPAHQLMSLFSSKCIQIGPNFSKIIIQELLISKNSKIIWDMLLLPTSTVVFLCYNAAQCSSDLLNLLPLNCILIDYGLQVEHDYELSAKLVTCAGFNACIGTSTASWGSIAGSPETAISTIHKASIAASIHGSFGMIIADWQTQPHHPAFCFSWPGILLGLGMSWNSSVHEDYLHARLPELLNLYVYQDAAQVTGYLNVELGRLEAFMHQSIFQSQKDSALNSASCKGSVLHQLLVDADAVLLDNFTFELLQQVIRHIKKFELELQKATPSCFQHGELILELRLAMDLLLFACRLSKVMVTTGLNPAANSCGLAVINVGISNLPPIARTDLANRLLALTEQFRAVWLSRNLPCGLQTSLCMFNSLLTKLIPENDKSLYSINGETPVLQDIYSINGITN